MTSETLFVDIETAVLLGVSSHPKVDAIRRTWRAGNGAGLDVTSGITPQFVVSDIQGKLGEYEIPQSACPCLFVSGAELKPERDLSGTFTVELTCVLPSLLLGRRLDSNDVEDFLEAVTASLHAPRDLANKTIPSRLLMAGAGSAIVGYSAVRLGVDGTDHQARVVAEVGFKLSPRVLLRRPIDKG